MRKFRKEFKIKKNAINKLKGLWVSKKLRAIFVEKYSKILAEQLIIKAELDLRAKEQNKSFNIFQSLSKKEVVVPALTTKSNSTSTSISISNNTVEIISKQGWLKKKWNGMLWQKRWAVLYSDKIECYRSQQIKNKVPILSVQLLGCSIGKVLDRDLTFELSTNIISKKRSLFGLQVKKCICFMAESAGDLHDWVIALQKIVSSKIAVRTDLKISRYIQIDEEEELKENDDEPQPLQQVSSPSKRKADLTLTIQENEVGDENEAPNCLMESPSKRSKASVF
jgi:hypothetical protein